MDASLAGGCLLGQSITFYIFRRVCGGLQIESSNANNESLYCLCVSITPSRTIDVDRRGWAPHAGLYGSPRSAGRYAVI